MNKNKIILYATDGLGNRLRAIDSAINLAKDTQRELIVIWEKRPELNASFISLFEPSLDFSIFEIDKRALINPLEINLKIKYESIVKDVIQKLVYKLNKIDKVFYQKDLLLLYQKGKNRDLISSHDGEFMNQADHLLIQHLITDNVFLSSDKTILISTNLRFYKKSETLSYYKPQRQILQKIDFVTSSFSNCVGLHIRRGDHVSSGRLSTDDKFINLINKEIYNDNNVKFYLSTDSNEVEMSLKEKFGNKIITYTKRSLNRNKPEAIEDAIIDMYSLSRTQRIYGSFNSSFSKIASEISGIPFSVVV